MKIEYTEDFGSKKKGDVEDRRDSLAAHFIELGKAKKFVPKRVTKEEKTAKDNK